MRLRQVLIGLVRGWPTRAEGWPTRTPPTVPPSGAPVWHEPESDGAAQPEGESDPGREGPSGTSGLGEVVGPGT
jgi:hypothetical protein